MHHGYFYSGELDERQGGWVGGGGDVMVTMAKCGRGVKVMARSHVTTLPGGEGFQQEPRHANEIREKLNDMTYSN